MCTHAYSALKFCCITCILLLALYLSLFHVLCTYEELRAVLFIEGEISIFIHTIELILIY